LPGVIYGRNIEPESLELVTREQEDLLHHSASESLLVDLSLNEKKRLALIQELQHHPLTGKVLHVDFHEVREDEPVTIMLPVETSGEPVGVKTGGGVLEHVLFKLKVRALPKNLPEQIVIDVTELETGKSIHVGEIKLPEGVEVIGNPNAPVVAVAAPKTVVEEAPAEGAVPAAAATTDVEMIKEKKEDAAAGDKKAAPAAEKKK